MFRTPTPPPQPPAPRFKTLRPGEKIDLSMYEASVASLRDQCDRLMGSVEEMRLENGELAKERDYYKNFWLTTKNYHEVMSQLNAATSQAPAPYAPGYNATAPSYNHPTAPLYPQLTPGPSGMPMQLMGNYPGYAGQYMPTASQYYESPYGQPPSAPPSAQPKPQQNATSISNEPRPGMRMTPPPTATPSQNLTGTNVTPQPAITNAAPPQPAITNTAPQPATPKREAMKSIDAYFGKSSGDNRVKASGKGIEQETWPTPKSDLKGGDGNKDGNKDEDGEGNKDGDGDGDGRKDGDGDGDGRKDEDGDGDGDGGEKSRGGGELSSDWLL